MCENTDLPDSADVLTCGLSTREPATVIRRGLMGRSQLGQHAAGQDRQPAQHDRHEIREHARPAKRRHEPQRTMTLCALGRDIPNIRCDVLASPMRRSTGGGKASPTPPAHRRPAVWAALCRPRLLAVRRLSVFCAFRMSSNESAGGPRTTMMSTMSTL